MNPENIELLSRTSTFDPQGIPSISQDLASTSSSTVHIPNDTKETTEAQTDKKSVKNRIKELNTNKNVFDNLFTSWSSHSSDGRASTDEGAELMEKLINEKTELILGVTIEKVCEKDENMFRLILLTFFGLTEFNPQVSAEKCLEFCEYPLYSCVVAAYVCHSMEKEWERRDENEMADEMNKLMKKYQHKSWQLLDGLYSTNGLRTAMQALEIDYSKRIFEVNDGNGKELMYIASEGHDMKFLSHRVCQTLIQLRWRQHSTILPIVGMLLISICSYFYHCIASERERRATKIQEQWNNLLSEMRKLICTGVKFLVHLVFRIAYLIFYGYTLITTSSRHQENGFFKKYWPELTIGFIQFGFIVKAANEIRLFRTENTPIGKKFKGWVKANKLQFTRSLVIFLNFLFAIYAVVRLFFQNKNKENGYLALLNIFSELLFHISFVFATLSSLRFLSVYKFFGPMVEMLYKMGGVCVKFLLVFFSFWAVYAVCHISLSESYNSHSNSTIGWLVFDNGAFEIFGEVSDENKQGSISSCNHLLSTKAFKDMNIQEVRCLFRSTLLPVIVFLYMMTASIMLVNLLTAQLTREYETVSLHFNTYWKYKRYSLLTEYESRIWFPFPFSIIYYLFKFVLWIILQCFTFAFIKNTLEHLKYGPRGTVQRGFAFSCKEADIPQICEDISKATKKTLQKLKEGQDDKKELCDLLLNESSAIPQQQDVLSSKVVEVLFRVLQETRDARERSRAPTLQQ